MPYLPVQPFLRVVGPQLLPVGHWEGREGQDVRRGIRQQFGHLGKELPELFHHPVQLGVDLGGRQLLLDGRRRRCGGDQLHSLPE